MPNAQVDVTTKVWPTRNSIAGTMTFSGSGRIACRGWSFSALSYLAFAGRDMVRQTLHVAINEMMWQNSQSVPDDTEREYHHSEEVASVACVTAKELRDSFIPVLCGTALPC